MKTRTCRGTRRACGSHRASRMARSTGPSWPRAGRRSPSVQPEWSPEGVLHLAQRPERVVEPLPGSRGSPTRAARADGRRIRQPSWFFDRSSYGFLADGSVVAVARSDGHDRLFHIRAGRAGGRGRVRRSPSSTGCGPGRRGRWLPSPARRAKPRSSSYASTRRRSRPCRRAPRSSSAAWPSRRASILVPETIEFRDQRRPDRARACLPAAVRDNRAPASERPALIEHPRRANHRRVDRRMNLYTQDLTSRGFAVVDVDYERQHRIRAAYRARSTGQWGIVNVDTASPATRTRGARRVERGHSRSRAGARAATRRSRALAFANRFAGGLRPYGVSDLEVLARETQKFQRATSTGSVGPYPGGGRQYRSARRSTPSTGSRSPSSSSGPRGPGRPPAEAEAIVAALAATGSRTPTLPSRRGHGSAATTAVRRSLEAGPRSSPSLRLRAHRRRRAGPSTRASMRGGRARPRSDRRPAA